MKAGIAATVALVGVMVYGSASAEDLNVDTGNGMLTACTDFLKDQAGSESKKIFESGVCAGQVHGVLATLKLMQKANPNKVTYCIPETGITNGQGVRVYVKFLNDYPEKLHMDSVSLAIEAFAQAYPCKRTVKPRS